MRGVVGLHIQKQITPTFGLGVEGQFGINTSSWNNPDGVRSQTVFDNSYVGAYGTVNLMNLFAGYKCEPRLFEIEAMAGAGWGHSFNSYPGVYVPDHNFFATKAGLNFNFNVSNTVTIALKPAVVWDMSDAPAKHTSASYNANKGAFSLLAGVTYKFGGNNFNCVVPLDPAMVAALNATVNDLRAQVDAANAAVAVSAAAAADLDAQLQACLNRAPETKVVKETTTNTQLNSVRYVFFKVASSVITADQMPNVEMIAQYMKNHPKSKVEIKGYASPEGNEEFNIRLAQARAESVKNALIKKYGISADRINAKGEGIGHMFEEESWNRVSICTLEATDK